MVFIFHQVEPRPNSGVTSIEECLLYYTRLRALGQRKCKTIGRVEDFEQSQKNNPTNPTQPGSIVENAGL